MNVAGSIAVGVISTVLMLFLNTRGLVDGPSPTAYNFFLTIAFLLLWTILGVVMGKAKKFLFIVFTVVFWFSGLVLSIISMILVASPLWLVSFLFLAPLNGLKYLSIFKYMFGYPLFVLDTLTPILVTLIGYFIGSTILKSKNDFEETKSL